MFILSLETHAGEAAAYDISIAFKKVQIHGAVQPTYQSLTSSCISSGTTLIQYGEQIFLQYILIKCHPRF